jgi:RNA polymerase sigma-70 factor (ECF subfamily)
VDNETLFKEILESHKDRVYRICCCYVHDRDSRDDAYQEVLIHIWRNLHTFQGRSSLGTWIYRIAVNTCLRHLETEKRRNAPLAEELRNKQDTIPEQSGSEEAEESEQAVQRLFASINRLPLGDKTLISLHLEDLSTREIAEVLEISEVNVRVKLHRIRRTLKNMLEVNNHGPR